MRVILLDGVGAGFLFFIFGLGLLFIVAVIFLEALVMNRMHYHPLYRSSLLHSGVANALSLAAGFVLTYLDSDLFQLDNMEGLGLLFVTTVVVEFLVLYLMNRAVTARRTLGVCLVMNGITYGIALVIILFNN